MFPFLKRRHVKLRMSEARADLLELAAERGRRRMQTASARDDYIYGSYDAAQTTVDNERHWAAADAFDADKANSLSVRKTTRERARYEVANNTYALGMILTLANDVVGACPRFQLGTKNKDLNTAVEQEWWLWARAIRLGAKLRTLRFAKTADGEAFGRQITNDKLPNEKLDLELIECDRVTAPSLGLDDKSVDGITFDKSGNPEKYHILKHHPGGGVMATGDDADDVDAALVYHCFRADRPGQHRGITEILPALPLFAHLRRYTLAVIDAAETAADFVGILHTDVPASGEAEEIEPMDAIQLERNTMLTMPGGWKMSQMESKQPTTTYGDFKSEILNEIARCLNMPFNIAACNSSSYNYASGRLDHQTYDRSVEVDRQDMVNVVLDPLTANWLVEAVKLHPEWAGEDVLAAPRAFMFAGRGHVDPVKESKSRDIDLKNLSTTLKATYAKDGRDWEEEVEQIAEERKKCEELGIPYPTGKGASDGETAGEGVVEAVSAAVTEAIEEALSHANR